MSYASRPGAPQLGGVFSLSGGLIGNDGEITKSVYPCDALKGVTVVLGVSEEDSHVPQARVNATRKILVSSGANALCDIFDGTEHRIFDRSKTKIKTFLSAFLHETVGNSTHDPFSYLCGYQASLQSEVLQGAVPQNQRQPRDLKYGLIAECVTGSPFCAPRATNLSIWFYRIHQSVATHSEFQPYPQPTLRGDFCCPGQLFTPEPVRWNAMPNTTDSAIKKDFVDSLVTIAGTGNSFSVKGMAIHVFNCNKDMVNRSFYNADGDLLVIPETGALNIQTECGYLRVAPGELFILPKGLKMSVSLPNGSSKGFISELFEISHFQLPNLGPIGSNGLADGRHFKVPTAYYEDRHCEDYELISKFGGSLFRATLQFSPYDVVGWSGRYHPCKYDLLQFMSLGSVTWDHCDPSLHTVLTCPVDPANAASACDVVCFRPRYDAAQHTFRYASDSPVEASICLTVY